MGESDAGAATGLRHIPGGVRFPAKIRDIQFHCLITTHALTLLPGHDPRPMQKFVENQSLIRRITARKVARLSVPLTAETLICILPEDVLDALG